jgi:large subunit ribosomal protein L28
MDHHVWIYGQRWISFDPRRAYRAKEESPQRKRSISMLSSLLLFRSAGRAGILQCRAAVAPAYFASSSSMLGQQQLLLLLGRPSLVPLSPPVTTTTVSTTPPLLSILPMMITKREYGSHRAKRGLYDGKDIRSGNMIPFSQKKTRRKFRPNVFLKRLYSETLDAMLPFHVTTAALRSIDKAGGLDNYILKKDCTEGEGLKHKQRIIKKLRNRAYLERKAAAADDKDNPMATAAAAATPSAATTAASPIGA